MLYDKLWEVAVWADWSPMTDEYNVLANVLAAGALVVAAVLIWNKIRIGERMRTIETQLEKMEKDIDALHIQESRRMMMKVKANSKAKVDVVKLTTSPPATPDQPESASFSRLLEWERQRPRSRWKRIIVPETIAAAVLAVALVGGYVLFTLIPGTAVVAVKKDDGTSTAVAVVKKDDDTSTGVVAVKEDNNTSTSVAAVKKDDDTSAAVAAVKEDDDTSAAVAAVKEDNNTSTSVAAVKKDDDTSAAVAAVKEDDDTSAAVAAVKEDNDTSAAVAAVKEDNNTSTSIAAVKKDDDTSTAVAVVKKDDDTSTGVAAVKEDNNTSTSVAAVKKDDDTSAAVAAVKKDKDDNAGGPTETAAIQLSAPTNTTGRDGPQDRHKGAEVPAGVIAPSAAATNSGDAEVIADHGRALRLPSNDAKFHRERAIVSLSESGKLLSAASGPDSSCLPSASAVRQNHPGGWPSWTLRAPGHEGTRCWYAATRDTAHDNQK